jgi:hypothetical protein
MTRLACSLVAATMRVRQRAQSAADAEIWGPVIKRLNIKRE